MFAEKPQGERINPLKSSGTPALGLPARTTHAWTGRAY
jgi:hypothetical protein